MYADSCTWHNKAPVHSVNVAPRKLFVVDDHPLMRKGYQALVKLEPDLTISDEAAGGYEALEKLYEIETDLVITDVSMEDLNGFELSRRIKGVWNDLPILITSSYSRERYSFRARQVGARGYIEKNELTTNGLNVIRCALTQQSCPACPFLFEV